MSDSRAYRKVPGSQSLRAGVGDSPRASGAPSVPSLRLGAGTWGTIIVIPARYGSTRFPGKALANLGGKPVIQWCYEAAVRSRLGPVLVATDDRRILKAVKSFGGNAVMTSKNCHSGTDRAHQAVQTAFRNPKSSLSTFSIVVNLQGDEPFISPSTLRNVVRSLRESPSAQVATAAAKISGPEKAKDPNVVKVAVGRKKNALYFSRSPIPHGNSHFWQHIGVYAYRRKALEKLIGLKRSRLEKIEKLEQLRALENGMEIVVCEVKDATIAIDTPGDLRRAERLQRKRKLNYD